MTGDRKNRLEKVKRRLKPASIIIVNWLDETFTCEGKDLTREEYERLRTQEGVTVVHFVDTDTPPANREETG